MAVDFFNDADTEEKSEDKKEDKEEKGLIEKINNYLLRFSRIKTEDKLFFVQYLAVMLKSGISLATALDALSRQTENKRFAQIIKDMKQNVEKGISFTDSLSPHQKVFGELFVNMVEAGELSGNLEKVLNQLYIQMKKSHQIASKIKGALTYPAVIVVAMIGVITFLVVSVLPQMAAMFKEFEAELPLPTRILIAFSDFVQANGIMMVGGILLFGLLVFRILTTKKGKYYFQAVLLKAPIVSPIIKKINLAKFARTVSSLLKTDIMIVKTFHITSKVLGNLHYRQAVKEVGDKIKKGKRISEIMKEYPSLFPPVVTQISQTGEETGELDSILEELAEFYEGEVDKTMDSLPSIIEPILIIVLGIGVGGVAMAIVMPMYSLTSSM